VARLRGNDPANPAARVVHVSRIAGDQVDVDVTDRLPRRLTYVDAEVVAARMKLTLDPRPHRVDELPQRRLLVGGEREVVRLVAAGHDERVAAGQRERVWKGGAELVLDGEVAGREAIAED